MIKEALLALKEKGGSSPHAIAKYMEEKHKAVLPENFKKMLALQLKNSASKGMLTKVKASYKLSESSKKEKSPATVAGKKKRTAEAKKPTKQTKTKKPAASAATATTAGFYRLSESGKKEKSPATIAGKKKTTAEAKKPTKQTKTKKPVASAATAATAGSKKTKKAPKKARKMTPTKAYNFWQQQDH